MPPSPGRIHDLPIKILYSLDTSPQSYVTVLPERQQVYIHPSSGPAHAASQEGVLGSCYLKAAVRGICFASPECIPNASTLDFSVYNLDPNPRPTSTRAFQHPAAHNGVLDESWTGKGFLSWIIGEAGAGKTLVKGRLVRETEFGSLAFNDQGGLEGLMAAAAARQSAPQREDMDGKGWGLEVGISLKLVNPDGKDEFKGRREFEEMMRRGTLTSVGNTTTGPQARGSSVVNSSPVSVASVASATPRAHHPEPIRRNPPSASSTNGRGGVNANGTGSMGMPAMPNFQHSSSNTSVHSQSHSIRHSPALGHQSVPHLPPPNRPASASSRMSLPSSLPPSSIPMSASSSAGAGPSNPPQRPSSSASMHRPAPQHAQPSYTSQAQHQQNNGSSAHASSTTHVASSRVHSREVTPPPLPQRRSPPPSTPSREKLAALLRTDEKMSPSMAKHLAQNPVLLKLLMAVPPTALNFGHDVKVGSGLANNGSTSNGHGNGNGAGGGGSPDSEGAPTPTPSGPTASGSTSKAAQKSTTTVSAEGCCNCGVKESELWRTKAMKDGTKKKVCNACGLYFNKHKRMRPAELWGTPATDDTASSHSAQMPPEKKIKLDEREPVRHSPRLARNVSSDHSNPPAFSGAAVAESPRRKRTSKPIPQPSPRMTTRASSRHDPLPNPGLGQSATGASVAQALDFSDSLFSPSTMFGTSPAVPAQQPNHALGVDATNGFGTANGGMGGDFGGMDLGGEIDIEALLNSIAAADGQNGFSLDAFFANNTDAVGADEVGGGVDMSGWVHDGDAGGTSGAGT